MAYPSNESGEARIYAREVATGRQWPISPGQAFFPRWSPRGDELIYRLLGGEVMSVTVSLEGDLSPSAPVKVTQLPGAPRGNFNFDHTGERLLYFTDPANPGSDADQFLRLNVVVNWFEELKQRLPSN